MSVKYHLELSISTPEGEKLEGHYIRLSDEDPSITPLKLRFLLDILKESTHPDLIEFLKDS